MANVAKYLEVFEGVVKQNGYEEYIWPLLLRMAVTGSKLEEIVELGGSYDEIKTDIVGIWSNSGEVMERDDVY